jgi:SAM-dependent methyltransferase
MDRRKVDVDEGSVSEINTDFFDHYAWVDQGGGELGEDRLSRSFPPAYGEYTAWSANRILALLAERGGSLLIVGCGDMPENHVRIAAGFHQVTCMDISAVALGIAERKLGASASYRRESIVETTLPDSHFDAAFCASVIFHISKDAQADAVRQLVRVIKPGGRVVIVYANPHSPFAIPGEIWHWFVTRIDRSRRHVPSGSSGILSKVKRSPWRGGGASGVPPVYYHAHSLRWWRRFATECDVTFMPCEVIGSRLARALLRSDRMAAAFFNSAAWVERKLPWIATRLWKYPILVLDKKARPHGETGRPIYQQHRGEIG